MKKFESLYFLLLALVTACEVDTHQPGEEEGPLENEENVLADKVGNEWNWINSSKVENKQFVKDHKGPVGALALIKSELGHCSGTLISDNRFITAGHCCHRASSCIALNEDNIDCETFKDDTKAYQNCRNFGRRICDCTSDELKDLIEHEEVRFNYEYEAEDNSSLHAVDTYKIESVVEQRYRHYKNRKTLDYMILKLKNKSGEGDEIMVPGEEHGYALLAPADYPPVAPEHNVAVIGHPFGQPKRIGFGQVLEFSIPASATGVYAIIRNEVFSKAFQHNAATDNNSSGSGVLSVDSGFFVGLHVGTTTPYTSSYLKPANDAIDVHHLIAESPTLQYVRQEQKNVVSGL